MDIDVDLRTQGGLVVPGDALSWAFARASGAGGQHINKTATKVTLDVDLDAVRGVPAAIERLRRARPDIAFSSDFIVGFPGETEEDFRDTQRLMAEVGFASAYSFKY